MNTLCKNIRTTYKCSFIPKNLLNVWVSFKGLSKVYVNESRNCYKVLSFNCRNKYFLVPGLCNRAWDKKGKRRLFSCPFLTAVATPGTLPYALLTCPTPTLILTMSFQPRGSGGSLFNTCTCQAQDTVGLIVFFFFFTNPKVLSTFILQNGKRMLTETG